MKRRIFGPSIFASALALAGLAVGGPLAGAQENSGGPPASNSLRSAGSSAENAASSTGHAIEHAYEGTKTTLEDTAITAKVKTALHENKVTKGGDIHVHTVGGVVTLKGTARSSQESETARRVARQTSGVRQVKNELTTAPTATR
ncbi:MAG TPA: BON domain-containing protein [Candidatus Binataceae bacterium]|nr:BON domain-containing protein [Candidatus Binataceae bacterium]